VAPRVDDASAASFEESYPRPASPASPSPSPSPSTPERRARGQTSAGGAAPPPGGDDAPSPPPTSPPSSPRRSSEDSRPLELSVDAHVAAEARHLDWARDRAADLVRLVAPAGGPARRERRCWNQSPVDGRPGISSNPSPSPKSNSFSMILEPLILASRVIDD